MKRVRCDLGERLQYEAALVQRGVRNAEAGFLDYNAAKQKNVDVDDARTFLLPTHAPQLPLDFQNAGEKLLGCLLRIQNHRAIQKPSLRGKFHRLGLVER